MQYSTDSMFPLTFGTTQTQKIVLLWLFGQCNSFRLYSTQYCINTKSCRAHPCMLSSLFELRYSNYVVIIKCIYFLKTHKNLPPFFFLLKQLCLFLRSCAFLVLPASFSSTSSTLSSSYSVSVLWRCCLHIFLFFFPSFPLIVLFLLFLLCLFSVSTDSLMCMYAIAMDPTQSHRSLHQSIVQSPQLATRCRCCLDW